VDLQPKRDHRLRKDRRFDRLTRLIGIDAITRLQNAHVMIFGLGGVGSWCAESLVRSSIGRLTLVDFDVVSTNNFNRQMPALSSTIGLSKAESLAKRLREISEQCQINIIKEPVSRFDVGRHVDSSVDFVVDAIDQLGNKCGLISYCVRRNIPIVTSGGAGGRLDPTRIRIVDMAETKDDALMKMVRVYLKKRHLFPRKGLFYVPCVVSEEIQRKPTIPQWPADTESVTPSLFDAIDPPQPDRRMVVQGTASFVTSVFGLTCASVVVRSLIGEPIPGLKKRPPRFKLPPEPVLVPHVGGKDNADDPV
jgi:tRNA threonylcarbamoyladenosine dehydratase